MKKFLILLISLAFCSALIYTHSFEKNSNTPDNSKNNGAVISIDYKNYTSYELRSVKAMLEERMAEFGIVVLGIGEDWVNIQVYELTDELESFLIAQVFPEYKSSVVRIEFLPEDVEIRPT